MLSFVSYQDYHKTLLKRLCLYYRNIHYIDSEKLADKVFSGGKVNVKDAKNNYIINFYTGTIIALYDSKSEISGTVKGLTDILLDVNGEI